MKTFRTFSPESCKTGPCILWRAQSSSVLSSHFVFDISLQCYSFAIQSNPILSPLPPGLIPSLTTTHNEITKSVSDTETYTVNCTVTSWQYLSNGTWETALYYPAEEPVNPTEFQELFSANGTDLIVPPVPASLAPALSDSLYGRTVQVNLMCDTEYIPATVEGEDSCVIFEVDFTNYR